MKWTKANALILVGILVVIVVAGAWAGNWFYSQERTTTVTDYSLTINTIPSNVASGTTLNFTGTLTFGGTPQANKVIVLFVGGSQTVFQNATDATGTYEISYVVPPLNGTILTFKVGYFA